MKKLEEERVRQLADIEYARLKEHKGIYDPYRERAEGWLPKIKSDQVKAIVSALVQTINEAIE